MNAATLILYGALAFVLWRMLSPISGAVGDGLREGVKAGQAGVAAVGGAVVAAADRSAVAEVPPVVIPALGPALGLYVILVKYFGTQTGRIDLPGSDAFIGGMWQKAAEIRPYLSPPLNAKDIHAIEKTLAAAAWNREKGYSVNLSEGAFMMAKFLYTEGAGAWNPALEVSYSKWLW